VKRLPDNFATVTDGMSLVQKVKGEQVTFGDVATAVLLMVLKEGNCSKRIDVVFDTYKENSIKNSERLLRGEETGHHLQSIASTQIVRQWRNFLSRASNKTSVIAFMVSEWKGTQHRGKLGEKTLYATTGEECFKITSDGCIQVASLQCNQEEADTRLLLHAAHAAKDGFQAVVICSEDTDVFKMLLAFHETIGVPLYQKRD